MNEMDDFKMPEIVATPEEADEWIWKNETLPRLRTSGFEARYLTRLLDWNCPEQEAVFRSCVKACIGTGAIVALVGERGTGKTTILAQMARLRAEDPLLLPADRSPAYRKMSDLIARFKPLYADFGTTETDKLMSARDALCSRALLLIDELHECDDQKLKDRVLTDIIDRRYSRKVDTVLVSNQDPEAFQRTTSDSILSRLTEHGLLIPCRWKSHRAK